MPNVMHKIGAQAEVQNSGSLIKVLNHWNTIMGTDLAKKSMPIRIMSKRQKNRDTGEQDQIMVLKLKTESGLSTTIAMRETIILDRLNRLFGTDKFQKLTIEHGHVAAFAPKPKAKKQIHHNIDLSNIDDPVLKSRLESLGQAVMNSAQE